MKKLLLVMLCALTLLFGFEQASEAQTKKVKSLSEQTQKESKIVTLKTPNIVALNTNELETFSYDAGKIKFIASSKETNGAYTVAELTEMPGYKTAWHTHNCCEESYYVLEGVLTFKINDNISDFPAGSYILVPRGTPHGQGNFSKAPVRFLLTVTPGGFDHFFKDRIGLYKTVKPGDAAFQKRFDELREKNKQYVEILGTWDKRK